MSIFFQIALGLSPITLLFALFSIFKKKARAFNIVITSMLVCSIATFSICALTVKPEDDSIKSEKDKVTQLDLIYSIASKEDGRETAADLLKDLRETATDSADLTLCDAYLSASAGDWKKASLLYIKAKSLKGEKTDSDKFLDLCKKAQEEANTDYAANVYFDETDTKRGHAKEELVKLASDFISKKSDKLDKDIKVAASVLIESNKIFADYVQGTEPNIEKVNSLLSSLNKANNGTPSLSNIEPIRTCNAKLNVLTGKHTTVARSISSTSGYDELAIASELYINGLVTDSSFSNDFTGDYKKKRRAVLEQLERLEKHLPKDKQEEKELVAALIEKLKDQKNDSGLEILKDGILAVATNPNSPDSPKAYIQLAKIAYKEKEENKSKRYISKALNSLGVCDDEEFYIPLSNIAQVITEKDNKGELKNVATYVDAAISNSSDKVVVSAVEKAQSQTTEENSDTQNSEKEFSGFMGDAVSQLRISVNITNVDSSEFPKVKATVTIDESLSYTAEELKSMITVTDCGSEIENFTVEKVEYKAANILLCCDTSGSMSGQSIDDLINAVKLFAETSGKKENLALITFDSNVGKIYDFGTDKNTISSAADDFRASGGTNMYDSIISSLDKFSVKEGELNYILLLSDGEDNTLRSTEDIYENIGDPCIDKTIVLYSLGLGSEVNIDYMDTIAISTNGEFVYINDSATLADFYETLRGQILNQYVVTYTAEDTLTVNRNVKIHVTEDPVCQDIAYYTIDGSTSSNDNAEDESILTLCKKGVYGLDTSLIYKSTKPTRITLAGFGFEKDDNIRCELDGKLDYGSDAIKCEFVNANTIAITLPGGIACGKYKVKITVDDLKAIFPDALTVVAQGSEKITEFGPYYFTSYEKTVEDGRTVLSNIVTLNSWLNFKGDIVLEETYDEREIKLIDNDGSYVQYFEGSAKGLAGIMAKKNIKLPLPALGEVILVNDPTVNAESEEYPVNPVMVGFVYFADTLSFQAPGISLYPNRIEFTSDAFSTQFPAQESVLKAAKVNNIFEFEIKIAGIVTNKTIGVKGEFSNQPEDTDVYSPVNLGHTPIYLSPANFTIKINTVENNYSIDFATKVAFIDSDGLGFYIEWKERANDKGLENLWPTEVLIKADFAIKSTIGPVPVTYSDFKLGLSDIDPNANILDWKLKGQFDLSTAKVGDMVPGLKKYISDPAVLSFDDTTIELSLGQVYFGIETELKVLEEITLGKAKIEAGKIQVTSWLLGLENDDAFGLRAEVFKGIDWHITNCDFTVGATTVLHAHSKFIGLEAKGEANVTIKWLIFKAKFKEVGTGVVGLQFCDDLPTFVIKIAKEDDKGINGYYLMWNERTNLDYGELEV